MSPVIIDPALVHEFNIIATSTDIALSYHEPPSSSFSGAGNTSLLLESHSLHDDDIQSVSDDKISSGLEAVLSQEHVSSEFVDQVLDAQRPLKHPIPTTDIEFFELLLKLNYIFSDLVK